MPATAAVRRRHLVARSLQMGRVALATTGTFAREYRRLLPRPLVDEVATLRDGNVQITLEIGRLFDILRRRRIQARSHMTMVNLALMTAEGLGKRLDATLQLNEAALPYLAEALGMSAPAAG